MADATRIVLPGQNRPKIFVSYSRADIDFADELVHGLEFAGFEVCIDRHSIAAGEAWQQRLGALILASDTVVFVLSPASATSDICAWEVDEATRNSKRVLPVVWQPVDFSGKVPQALKALNAIPMDGGREISGLIKLVKALNTNLEWLRQHTQLAERAEEWQASGRADDRLLRGTTLGEARLWLEDKPGDAPEPTDMQRAYLAASEDAEVARSNAEVTRLREIAAAQDERERALEREKSALHQADRALRQAEAALRNRQGAQAAIGALLVCVIAGLVGWINQDYLKTELNWYLTMRPYMLANFTPHVLSRDAERALEPRQEFHECAADCPKMVVIPAGTFVMGSPETEAGRTKDEGPLRTVTISRSFAMSKYPVTFGEWNACVAAGGCPQVSDSGFGAGMHPAVNVNWDDAKTYLSWLSRMTGHRYRLASEAEWEYAARGGTDFIYAWGNEVGRGNANCVDCGSQWDNRSTSPSGSFKPNAFGLYDIQGNIWQWVEDCYHDTYDGAPVDGSAWTTNCWQSRRSVRGGAWDSYAINIRTANRDRISIGNRINDIGFRALRELE